MKRVNRFNVDVEPGEVLEFEDVFPGKKFGEPGRIKQLIGHRIRYYSSNQQEPNSNSICIHFKTGLRTETNVGWYLGGTSIQGIGDNIDLIIAEAPFALSDDPTRVEPNVTFLSADGRDPQKNATQMVSNPNGPGMMSAPVLARPDGGFKPDTDYYVTYRWRGQPYKGLYPPIAIQYYGTDDPEHGGERLLSPSELPIHTPTNDFEGVPMTFNGQEWICFPA